MRPYFKELLHVFNEENVEYLLVGAHAVMHYTEPRFTKDHDVWVNPTEENAKRVFKALAIFGVPLTDARWEDFAVEGNFYQIGTTVERIDVITKPAGLKFDDCWARRVDFVHDGLLVHIISREDLIANKKLCGRPQDILDLEKLNSYKKIVER